MKTHFLRPRDVPELQIWAEVFIFTALALGLPVLFNAEDPFWTEGGFSWPVLGPLLVSLRYGFSKGFISILCLLVGQLFLLQANVLSPQSDFNINAMIGYIIVIMITGEFRDVWERTNQQQSIQLEYVTDRLETFTRQYHLINSSHDRIEQMLAGHTLSLRESLQAVRTSIGLLKERRLDSAAQKIIDLFVEYGLLERAGLYKVENDTVLEPPLASIGQMGQIAENDPLILAMIEEKELVSVKDAKTALGISKYHMAIPLIDVNNTIYGAILVERVQFFALKNTTLTLLAVMAGHIGDLLRHEITNPVMTYEESPYFIRQVKRANKEAKRYNIPSQLLKIKANNITDKSTQLMSYLSEARRGLDIYLYDNQNQVLLLLMPLADELEKAGFIARMNTWCKERTGNTLAELDIVIEQQLALPISSDDIKRLVSLS
ncbi:MULTISPECIES: PelD GGDEF domain-containing protein [unclassified Pseudoalteromonas]|uniref:PelD GGDEF domain-containing protein n=1 Tax=Pseudoalteromonas sp. RB2-MNA-CIBAN-0110 TaxID=3140439 RepID=UPI0004181102|nr:PelD GGDEF domain-containing protein [Pseudoalteromonas sp. TB13]